MSGRTLRRMLRSPGFVAKGYRYRRHPRLAAPVSRHLSPALASKLQPWSEQRRVKLSGPTLRPSQAGQSRATFNRTDGVLFGSRLRSSGLVCGRGCGVRTWVADFEDVGPVRPEDCFPVPRVSVVRGDASASPAGREFEIAYVDAESGARRLALIDAWSVPFEECLPVRGFPSYKGQRNHVGRWWTATTGSLVGYESGSSELTGAQLSGAGWRSP